MPSHSEPLFTDLGLPEPIVSALQQLGYERPTPVQAAAIPPLLEGRDVLAQAATGTGKTAAFALPMLSGLKAERTHAPFQTNGLVLTPTRELALQVTEALRRYGAGLKVSVTAVYGGEPIGHQLKSLKRGVDVVVATPGRALDHLERGTLQLGKVQMVVLDEADEMLDMGFADDLEKILSALPRKRQTALFSATMPSRIQKIAEGHLSSPLRLTIAKPKPASGELPKVRQVAYVVPRAHKMAALVRVLQAQDAKSALVFCRTREEVDQLAALLPERGLSAEALHGGLDQPQRDRVMRRFKSGAVRLLIATDVAARGLDIDHLSLVVNFDLPTSAETYVHRIGRTGRAGREGVALTIIEPSQQRALRSFERTVGTIAFETVPSAAQLEQQRLERTKALVIEAAGNSVGAELKAWLSSAGIDIAELGAAAVMLLHREHFGAAEIDLADIPVPRRSAPRERKHEAGPRGHERGPERGHERRPQREMAQGRVALFVSVGSEAGVRPGDLVGAIANEAGLQSRDIGPIQIQGRFSLVGVPEEQVDAVIRAMKHTTIRGRKATIRRDRDV